MNSINSVQRSCNLTILVNTCDAYSDVLSLFFAAFSEYWPECNYDIVVNTENNKHVDFPARVHNYSSNNVNSWGERLLKTLQTVNTEFVMVLYDDFILENNVNIKDIEKVVSLMVDDPSIAVFYLVNTSLPMERTNDKFSNFSEIVDYSDFKLNSFPAIWRKSDLANYTKKNDNPWAWEVFGSYRTFNDGKRFLSLNGSSKDIYEYNYSKGGAIYRGRWVREVVAGKFEKYMLSIDPSIRGYADELISEKRDFKWKVQFMLIGFKMVGFKSLKFIPRYLKAKFNAKK